MAGTASPAAGYGSDGVYRSPRPAAPISSDPGLSIADLVLRRAVACPSAPALVDAATGQPLTFGALRSAVLVTAAALYPVCFLAVTALGAIATTANPLYTPREIAKQAADARAKLVVTVSDLLPKIAGLCLPTVLLDVSVLSDFHYVWSSNTNFSMLVRRQMLHCLRNNNLCFNSCDKCSS